MLGHDFTETMNHVTTERKKADHDNQELLGSGDGGKNRMRRTAQTNRITRITLTSGFLVESATHFRIAFAMSFSIAFG